MIIQYFYMILVFLFLYLFYILKLYYFYHYLYTNVVQRWCYMWNTSIMYRRKLCPQLDLSHISLYWICLCNYTFFFRIRNARWTWRFIIIYTLGGILKGPVLMMMLNYSLQESTFISYALVFGGCLLNTAQIVFIKYYIRYIYYRHPDYPNRPIIDYNLAMITNCAISLGSNIGSMLNILFAQFYLTIF